MKIGQAGLSIIQDCESLRLQPYLCPAGWWTIGWGAIRLRDGSSVNASTPSLTHLEADQLLERDVCLSEQGVSRLIHVVLSQLQFDALCSFTFNLGTGNLQASTLRAKINRGEYAAATGEFSRWVYGGGRRLAGLVSRRMREERLWEAGTGSFHLPFSY